MRDLCAIFPRSREIEACCKALLFSAEDPEVTCGASGSFFWWDELAKAKRAADGWNNMLFGMREGRDCDHDAAADSPDQAPWCARPRRT